MKFVVHGVRENKCKWSGNRIASSCEKVIKGSGLRPHFYTIYSVDADGLEHAVVDYKKKSEAVHVRNHLNESL